MHHTIIRSLTLIMLVIMQSFMVCAQRGDDWKVWVKISPCSGRQDWMTVSRTDPSGGGNMYQTADRILSGTACTSTGCSFTTATEVAAQMRQSVMFSNYCCRDYSVWEQPSTGKKTVVVGKFGTAGSGWVQVKSGLCCEEAEALAGIPGACSAASRQDKDPKIPECWPGSTAKYNRKARAWECFCNPGLVWNATKTACVDPQELVRTTDCSMYGGSYAAWNEQMQRVECYCPTGKVWNSAKTACIDGPVQCYPGSTAAYNPETKRTECFCNTGLVWNAARTACVEPPVQCYPGSYSAYNPQTKRTECFCNTGLVWNATKTACVQPPVQCYPGSYSAYNPQTQRTECFCNTGLVWNATKTACVQPTVQCYPGSYAAYNPQTQRTECFCNPGLVWNATNTACVQPGNVNPGGSGTWVLTSTTAYPATAGSQWTSYSPQGSAGYTLYNGDRAAFQWTPPPSSFGAGGFNMSINVSGALGPNSKVLAALISVSASGLTSSSSNTGASANIPGGGSGQNSFSFTPGSSTSDVEVTVALNWGDAKFVYKYRRQQ